MGSLVRRSLIAIEYHQARSVIRVCAGHGERVLHAPPLGQVLVELRQGLRTFVALLVRLVVGLEDLQHYDNRSFHLVNFFATRPMATPAHHLSRPTGTKPTSCCEPLDSNLQESPRRGSWLPIDFETPGRDGQQSSLLMRREPRGGMSLA